MQREFGVLQTKDKAKIAYYHYKGDNDKLVVIAHGFYNSKDAVVLQELAKILCADYDVIMFDFRGHGKSTGLFSWMSKENNDLETVIDYARKKNYKKTGLISFSIGASISINTLSKSNDLDALICVSPVSEFSQIDYNFWALNWQEDLVYTLFNSEGRTGKGVRPGAFWLKKEKPIDNVSKLKIPTLFIHGLKDWVIAPRHSKELYEKTTAVKKLLMIENGPHAEYMMKDFKDIFIKEVKDWFKEHLNKEEE
ncbi:MAG: alpha/beta fold hydrolase [Candidatus Omnitrophica bacterium]|nr:alpha/beta fold hydrolase [Candidatus Omnitrophota bacterium]